MYLLRILISCKQDTLDFSIGQHQEMSREALEIILSCWSPGGPDDYVGKYWTIKKPNYSENYYWHLIL